jgi:hypothetical protein
MGERKEDFEDDEAWRVDMTDPSAIELLDER